MAAPTATAAAPARAAAQERCPLCAEVIQHVLSSL